MVIKIKRNVRMLQYCIGNICAAIANELFEISAVMAEPTLVAELKRGRTVLPEHAVLLRQKRSHDVLEDLDAIRKRRHPAAGPQSSPTSVLRLFQNCLIGHLV